MEINSMNIDQIAAEQTKLTADLLKIEKRIKGLQQQVSESEATVTTLNGKYEQACLDVASGKDADPSAPAAARDRESHKLLGLRKLLEAANSECVPAAQRHQALSIRLEQLREKEQDDILLATQTNTYRGVEAARKALAAANAEWDKAVKALDAFRSGVAGRARRRAQGLG